MKKKIYIAIPSRGYIVDELVGNLINWSNNDKYNINIKIFNNLYPLDNARNTIVKDFLKTDCDYIWWIDDDIVPPVYTLEKLLQADKDIISAVCFSMRSENGDYFPYPVTLKLNDSNQYKIYYGNGIEEVDAVGGACVLAKRAVYENIERPYEFVYFRDGTLALTCDFNIWRKIKKMGFKVFVDFNILCDHKKTCSIKSIQDLIFNLSKK